MLSNVTEAEIPPGETSARHLLKRTPTSYLLNQIYGLWVFVTLFILTLIMTRKVSVVEYGIYVIASTGPSIIGGIWSSILSGSDRAVAADEAVEYKGFRDAG